MLGRILIAIVALGVLMVVHEGGHYLAARAYGMRVTKFSIGFGPTFFKILPEHGYFWFTTAAEKIRIRLWRHDPEKHGPTVFQVAMIPFFAYVKIDGMNPFEEVDPADKGSYANASITGRIVAIFAGPLANYLFASVFFFASLMIGGKAYQTTEINVVRDRPDRPAAMANLQDGDRIVEIDGTPVDRWEKMAEIISRNPGRPISVVVERKGERVEATVTPADEGGHGKIGVSSTGDTRSAPVTIEEAGVLAVTKPTRVVQGLVIGLGQLVTGKAGGGDLGGPIRIIDETAKVAKRGWPDLLDWLGILSAYLGAFNLVPFPALDGGRLMFLFYEATTRRRPNARIEAHIHALGLLMLLGLMVYVTVFNDLGLGSK